MQWIEDFMRAFCVFCGRELAIRTTQGSIVSAECKTGACRYSDFLVQELSSFIRFSSPESVVSRTETRFGGAWYCPFDGTQIEGTVSPFQCGSCSRIVPNRILYLFNEFHSHRGKDVLTHEAKSRMRSMHGDVLKRLKRFGV